MVENILSKGLPVEKQAEMARIIKESDPEEVSEMISNVERVLKEAFEKTQMDSLAMGKLEGREENAMEVARKMLDMDMNTETIKEITGIPLAEIVKLRH